MGSKKKKSKKVWGVVALLMVSVSVAALVVVGLNQLFSTKEETISNPPVVTRTSVLVCDAKAPQEAFFAPEGARDPEHEIKVTYSNETAEELTYTYDADFGTPEAVKNAEATLHANYNIFMGKNAEDFSGQFMPMGDELKISIYAEAKNLGSETSKIFFINTEEFDALKTFDVKEMAKIFRKKGFSCEFDDD